MSKERTISGGLRQGLEKARGIRRVAGGGTFQDRSVCAQVSKQPEGR